MSGRSFRVLALILVFTGCGDDPHPEPEAVCGDGVLSFGEACEPGGGACCDDTCNFVESGTMCRAAVGACDVAEACTGASAECPADGHAPAFTICRDAAGACDVAEFCAGDAATCPTDVLASASTTCRAASGECDVAEMCTGTDVACPTDGFAAASTMCRAAAGDCDLAELCTGDDGACPADLLANASTMCRAAAGDCDVAESCTGTAVDCPTDVLVSASTTCRAAAGDCDVAESCTGTTADCPADVFATASAMCRPSAGLCDVAESCTGSSIDCPADALVAANMTCRAPASDCDVAESCSGSNPECPEDIFVGANTTCDDCGAGIDSCGCDDAGVCINQCGDGELDSSEVCDGDVADSCPGFCQSDCTCGVAPSCLAYFENGAIVDGFYSIDPDGTGAISVYCDMTNGGYTYWVIDGLVAYWSFDGTSFANADVGGITGTAVGSVTQQTVRPGSGFGTSVHFNETDANRIALANGITVPSTSTIMFWARAESCTNNRFVLMQQTGSTYMGDVRFAASAYRNGVAVFYNSTDTCTPNLGTWLHSTYVDSGIAMTMYRNGESVTPTTYNYSTFSGVLLNRMGSRESFGTNGLHGWLDDVAVFDRALTPAEIKLIHDQGRLGRPLRWR